jgi:tyrosine-specific transport protein
VNTKKIGGILMITGNAIGGGMLALPLATAQAGFMNSTLFLIACWAMMLAGGLLILEVNLWFPANSHLISMARATLGPLGEIITWFCYLLLLYSLLAAYIAGGADFLKGLLQKTQIIFSLRETAILFALSCGLIVYQGIHSVDLFNRALMSGKLFIYILLIALIFPFLSLNQLHQGHLQNLPTSLTIMITSFGFAAVIPSLRSYFHSDVHQLRTVIILGSLIPLICYSLWNAAIMGIIPLEGNSGLVAIGHSQQPTSELTNTLNSRLNKSLIHGLIWGFTSICLITSFLGVGLSLVDFLRDGLGLNKSTRTKNISALLAFFPPLIMVLFFPALFLSALSYAGICCAGLLALLPALMAWSGRYRRGFSFPYQVSGGKILLGLVIGTSSIIIIHALMSNLL